MRTLATVLAVLLAVPAFAQEMPKPGKEHELLKKMVGTWDTTMKVEGQDVKGTTVYKSDLGGFWVTSTLESEMFGQKFTGKGMDGYCPVKKKYLTIWTDSMGPSPVIMEGTYDAETKTITMTGDGPDMEGGMTKYKSITKLTDDDHFSMTMYVGDVKEPAFVIEYKRKK